MIEFIQTMGGV